jgi:hypothetical protein
MLGQIAVGLGTALIPLFGLPIFVVAWPRPRRFWSSQGHGLDEGDSSLYYQQSSGAVCAYMSRAAQLGRLGDIRPGSHFLLRFENRLVWIQVLECGHDHIIIALKGLELQETSCHTEEASAVEDVFEATFSRKSRVSLNRHWMHTLHPVQPAMIQTYSDTRNVLTGIIDSPETVRVCAEGVCLPSQGLNVTSPFFPNPTAIPHSEAFHGCTGVQAHSLAEGELL